MRQRALRLCVPFAVLGTILAICILVYENYGVGIPCLFHTVTGLACAGCGSFRALCATLHGQFYQALRHNALLIVLSPLLLYLTGRYAYFYIREGISGPRRRSDTVLAVAAICLACAFGIARNLPWFAWLSPTALR